MDNTDCLTPMTSYEDLYILTFTQYGTLNKNFANTPWALCGLV